MCGGVASLSAICDLLIAAGYGDSVHFANCSLAPLFEKDVR